MSDDLIGRKALLEKLEVFNDRDHGNEHFLLGIESAKEIIKNEPAAFDKEKVIEELKANMNSVLGISGQAVTFMFSDGYYNGVKDAIEIVEKGGIE